VQGDEKATEKYFKPKNASLMLCKACNEKVKVDPMELKRHVVTICKKQ
jgi:hypothetical protein